MPGYGIIYTSQDRSSKLCNAKVAAMSEYGFPLLFATIEEANAWIKRYKHILHNARPAMEFEVVRYIRSVVEVYSGRLIVIDGEYTINPVQGNYATYEQLLPFLQSIRNRGRARRAAHGIPRNAL